MRRLGFLAAVTAAILFGVGGTFAQFLFQRRGFSIDWLVTMRLLGAGSVLLLLSAIRQGRGVFAIWRSDPATILVFGLIGMMPVQYTYLAAIAASNTATATVLQFTAPAMIAAWFACMRGRLPDGRALAAILLAMAGTALLVTHGRMGALSISAPALAWGLASAVAAAFCSIQPAALLRRYDTATVGGWGMLVGGVALSLFHAPWRIEGVWDAASVFFFAFILLFGTLLAFHTYIAALRLIGPQMTSLLTCAEPLSAALLAVLWLGLPWSGVDWLGMVCILATIALLAKEKPQAVQAEKVT
jgi:drug/metabolite transporter (DMT)-like permease